MTLYNNIYKSEEDFLKYEESIQHTLVGKKKIVNYILTELERPVINKDICFFPSDIGHYYRLFSKSWPKNQFHLIDKLDKPLSYIIEKKAGNEIFYKLDACLSFELNPKFDLLFTILAIHLFNDINIFINNVYNNLKENGEFYCVFLSKENIRKHIMTSFFKKNVNKFHTKAEIIDKLKQNNFKSIEIKSISFDSQIEEKNIPLAFNKHANSFLYQQEETSIFQFQSYLKQKCIEGRLNLTHDYCLIKCKKI